MRSSVLPISGCRTGTYVLLDAVLPERPPCTIGVLLIDADTGRPWFRMRRDFANIAEPEDAEVLEAVEEHIRQCLAESGSEAFLNSLEDTLSNTLRVSPRETVSVDAFSRVLDRLYREHVEDSGVQRFGTHLPLFSLRAAAGGLSEEMLSEAEDWVPAPEGMRLSPDLFVAHVDRPVDGAAHSRWQFESLPPAPGGLAAGQDSADRALRRGGPDRALHDQALHEPQGRHVARTNGGTNRSDWNP